MVKLSIPIIFFVFTGFGQSTDSLRMDIFNECDKNFSSIKKDSSYCNFYIKDFKDTMFFRFSSCIFRTQTTSPLTFKRRIKNGYANGFIRFFSKNDNSYSLLDGNFNNGFIISGSQLEYYNNGILKLSGQYEFGHRSGIWTWYYENGKINRIIVYEIADVIREIEYDINGEIIFEYDFVKEKAKISNESQKIKH